MIYAIYLALVVVGFFAGYLYYKKSSASKIEGAENRAEKIINDAKAKQKKYELEAQEKALKIIEDSKKEEATRRREINELQKRLEERETSFSQKLLALEEKQQKLYDKVNEVQDIKEKIKEIKEEQLKKLEKIAEMTPDQAKEILLKNVEEKNSEDLLVRINKLKNESDEIIKEKAMDMLAFVIQRLAPNYTAELTTTTVDLPNDEMKGRIIGREGRNIKSIEQMTGVEIIVDDTPNAITISGFSLIRRHVAKKALEYLLKDGRIHPTKIEDAVAKAKIELSTDIKKAGDEAIYEIGVAGFDPKLTQIIGRLKYRTSYGQNALEHSIEVAHLSGMLARELGADANMAKKAGLLHDIGKAVDHEVQGNHTEIGRDILKKFNMPEEIITPVETHHDDNPPTLLSIIVKTADAISSARPGARHDSYENYIQRLEELEGIANSFEGVEKSYAIQAGREVRIFISPEKVDDLKSYDLARDIAKKIEQELKYPGEIKVNIIRELRVIEYAR
ncbi:MAG: ribonuclease Y [Patescibacteria group bacterium]|nr:ribonuclease Y [Patescibacteria group bacterium]